MFSNSIAQLPPVSGVPAVSSNELSTLIGGGDPSLRTSAQQKQAQEAALRAFSLRGTLAENASKAVQSGLSNLAFINRVDALNTPSGLNSPSQASGSQRTDLTAGQQGSKKNDSAAATQEPLSTSIQEADTVQKADTVEPPQESAAIAAVRSESAPNRDQPSLVQRGLGDLDRKVVEGILGAQNRVPGSVPPSISLQSQPEALARLNLLRAGRSAASDSTPLVNLVQGDPSKRGMDGRPASNTGLSKTLEPSGHLELTELRDGVSSGRRTDSRQVPVGSGVAINLSDGVLASVPKEKVDSLSFA